ncbi:MAG: pyrroline-5-carboxylate reductase [Candidatus Omnitrophota bacterium]
MKLGVIGCGNMGNAIAKGILSSRILPFNSIYISDKDPQKTKELFKKFGIRLCSNEEMVKKCDVIILAVKPQNSGALLSSISGLLDGHEHLVSVMAGIAISKIESVVARKIAITRAMPNMAALAGKSATCVCHNNMVESKVFVTRVFSSIGTVVEMGEEYMDAVTALSGSGPAYFLYLAECMRDAAIKLGIKGDKASELAVATLIGSGALIDSLKVPPEVLRKRITSKRGTTAAALNSLQKAGFKETVELALRKAFERSKELSV